MKVIINSFKHYMLLSNCHKPDQIWMDATTIINSFKLNHGCHRNFN